MAQRGDGGQGWDMEIFPTEVRATGFSVANFTSGISALFYARIPAIMGSVAASFPIFAASYALLAVAFMLLKDTIREGLIDLVGDHAGEAPAMHGGAVALTTSTRAVAGR